MSFEPWRSGGGLRAGAVVAALLLSIWAAPAAAQPPRLVADLNTQPVNGSALPPPFDFFGPQRAELGGVLYFAATDLMHGQELWRSDGTPEGTRLVRDVRPGSASSNILALTTHRGRLYFFADDGVWGLELWSSDGTPGGTRLVRDLCPGPCPGAEFRGSIASSGDRLYFTAGPFNDLDLWRTDGTREGTQRILDACPGCSNSLEKGLTPLPGGRILFAANHPEKGVEPWVSDGTPEGTAAFDLVPGLPGSGPAALIALGSRVLFWAYDSPRARHSLWSSDGTSAGTRMVRDDSLPPSFDSGPVVWNGAVWFANTFGELWRTDGTPGGTVRVKTFDPSFPPTRLTPLPGSLLFLAGDNARGMTVWRTRGTPATTRMLKDPSPGSDSPVLLQTLRGVGNRAFFLTQSFEGLTDLWVSDGSTAGTRRVATVCQTADQCLRPDHLVFAETGRLAFFTVHSRLVGSELWRSDGSAAGTFLVRDIHRGPGSALINDAVNQVAHETAALDGRVLFGALTTAPGAGPATLWSSDGTAAGTVQVGGDAPWPQDFVRQGDHLYFAGALPWSFGEPFFLRREGLWRTDGTRAGTELLGDLFDLDLLALDRDLLFLRAGDKEASNEGTGIELWRSDGTPGGTRQVLDLDQQTTWSDITSPPMPLPGSSDPGPPVRLGSVLLFAADDGLAGRELWATDGTQAGTHRVRNINQHDRDDGGTVFPGSSDPEHLVRLGEVVLFTADDGFAGRELWVTDGTAAGTHLLRDLRPGGAGSRPHDLVELGGRVYFFAAISGSGGSAGIGEALWVTDGTPAGTVLVKNLARQGLPSWGRNLTAAGGRLFFVADNEAIGSELHVSDGTAAGTRLVRQIRPGPNGSYPQALTAVDGVLVFAADNGTQGLEPWRSDGTAAGTYPLGDLAPGLAASAPSAFTAAGSLLFFGADDGVHGRELWTTGLPH